MANTVTKRERRRIQQAANGLISLGADKLAVNHNQVVESLIAQFGISTQRARTHAAKAARLKRRPR
jgi:long-subunit acyl-CoA synthetase (AMP-forming)